MCDISDVNHEMEVGLNGKVVHHPRYSRSFVPRYTVHERALYFNSTFLSL